MPETEDPSGDLLRRIRGGDESAFEDLYRSQGRVLLACILRIVRNRSLAEEVLQDVFAEVWTRCAGFDPDRGTGRAWLVTLSRRRAVDRVRAVQSQQDRDFAEGVKEVHTDGTDVHTEVVAHMESVRTVTALRELPEDQARAIALAYYQDMSHREISEHLQVPLGTVKSRVRDGMARLRAQLGVDDDA
ncbi:sigma-70 family RNA polymerase sigma factor [Nesterenkonia marinintestina]|uniref:sigma-70 family RNA polymerase sigma factor n=1 Tax=Nesterenkonia marinintestina TaxID=2979865 RepID=UPI0021BE9FAB|nr:sigma-70 family RNA polymerase sigma factor [Nesterenkonia sp. GX14115]